MLLGVHCSIRGGLHNAFSESASLGIDTFQVFTKNQRQWKEKIIDTEEKSRFLNTYKTSRVKMIFSHASYLINLASNDDTLWERSTKALIGEVQRCRDLGLDFTILHPGSAKELGEQKGLKNLRTIHLNDSKGELGSNLDRHEHIGKGKLGLEPFRQIMNRFTHIPKVIETPKKDNMDAVNLEVLRGLIQ